ncbi:hypothetical protein SEVIR_5G272701v4 [Setaria viridis]
MPCFSSAHLQKRETTLVFWHHASVNFINQPREVGHPRASSSCPSSLPTAPSTNSSTSVVSKQAFTPTPDPRRRCYHTCFLQKLPCPHPQASNVEPDPHKGSRIRGRVHRERLLPRWRDGSVERGAFRIRRLFLHILHRIKIGASRHLWGIAGVPAGSVSAGVLRLGRRGKWRKWEKRRESVRKEALSRCDRWRVRTAAAAKWGGSATGDGASASSTVKELYFSTKDLARISLLEATKLQRSRFRSRIQCGTTTK